MASSWMDATPLPIARLQVCGRIAWDRHFCARWGFPRGKGEIYKILILPIPPKSPSLTKPLLSYLKGVDPLGHHIAAADDPKVEYTIVGVAGNSRYTQVREADRPMAYLPFAQSQGVLEMQYELHSGGDPKMLIREAATVVHDTDPNLPLEKLMTQQDQFAETISQERLMANLSVFFCRVGWFSGGHWALRDHFLWRQPANK